MPNDKSITFREAVMGSILAHAGLVIVYLLNPGLFTSETPALRNRDPNEPIPLQFLSQPRGEDPALLMADAGDGLSSDPRPENAPPAENDDPYAAGNTPNKFLAPPVASPPSPLPGMSSEETDSADENPPPAASSSAEEEIEQDRDTGEEVAEGEDPGDSETPFETADSGDLPVRGPGEGGARQERDKPQEADETGERNQDSLRDALGRLSTGIGGDPLRFDNPVGGIDSPSGGLSFDTKDFNWGPYARRIYWVIWTNWTQGWPPAAHAGLRGVVTVRFRIWRDGTITGIQILDMSGTPAFDTCATVALEASSPLPPLPPDFPKDSEGITARFFYNMRATGGP